jgi:hypothetical protein
MKAYGGVDVLSIFSWPRHYLEPRCQLHAPAALLPGKPVNTFHQKFKINPDVIIDATYFSIRTLP